MENLTSFYYRYLRYIQSKDDTSATTYDKYMALSYAVRSQMMEKWITTQNQYHNLNPRRVYYLSMEYVFGKSLKYNIINLGLEKSAVEAAENLGFSLEDLYKQEEDFDLGNPGIGRLAASFLDSMATLNIPAIGYGLHYDYALFKQRIKNGMQFEQPYDWLHKGHPWEIKRPEYKQTIGFYGSVKINQEKNSNRKTEWNASDIVIALPYDYPISGYRNNTVNTLRLWSAQASEEFLPDYINHGDYVRACEEKFQSGRITNYLFPDEDVHRATEMRIKQQYFFVSASLQDIIRRYKLQNFSMSDFDKKVCIQIYSSRCAIAIAELMRILIDIECMSWDEAWRITQNTFAYTSNAVCFDNLERWPFYLIEEILPRHTQIIYDINQWHINNIRKKKKYSNSSIHELSIVEKGEVKWAQMANLAFLGSSYVNGVSNSQTEILKKKIYHQFTNVTSTKIVNKTNGISIRRWVLCANKPLASLITELIGDLWITQYKNIRYFEDFIGDDEVIARVEDIKHTNKRNLQKFLRKNYNLEVNPDTFFDVQCKKIHPYKRQMLHVFYILSQYLQLRDSKEIGLNRTHIFGGKAAPSDYLAKQIIHFINIVSNIVNNDSSVNKKMSVVFIPNYGVSLAEYVIPSADLSEQLSTAMYEASGTSNMKFALNGAVTLASFSGSNIEMIEKLGEDTILSFGHSGDELESIENYNPHDLIGSNKELENIFSFLDDLLPRLPDGNFVNPLLASLRDNDPYYVLLDFEDYYSKQNEVDRLYKDRKKWLTMSIKSIARSGWFSSDRTVNEFSKEIWKISGK
jgi:starch phosphorylase